MKENGNIGNNRVYRIDDSEYEPYRGEQNMIAMLLTKMQRFANSKTGRVLCSAISEAKDAAIIAFCDGVKTRIQSKDNDDHDFSEGEEKSECIDERR
ncbi:MAG: hypothetical protein J5752_05390 [Clostridiales bacterium]|nr:hypothetical protein [Clostridiales bacterium]